MLKDIINPELVAKAAGYYGLTKPVGQAVIAPVYIGGTYYLREKFAENPELMPYALIAYGLINTGLMLYRIHTMQKEKINFSLWSSGIFNAMNALAKKLKLYLNQNKLIRFSESAGTMINVIAGNPLSFIATQSALNGDPVFKVAELVSSLPGGIIGAAFDTGLLKSTRVRQKLGTLFQSVQTQVRLPKK